MRLESVFDTKINEDIRNYTNFGNQLFRFSNISLIASSTSID